MGWRSSGKEETAECQVIYMLSPLVQGGEKYQQAFYVYEELAQGSSTFSVQSLIAQAVCEIHLGRLEEAQSALEQALQKDPTNAEGIANLVVLNSIAGKNSTEELLEYACVYLSIGFPG